MSRCGICSADNLDKLEVLGAEAVNGVRSWRSAAEEAGLTHHQALKNHMERHVVAKADAAIADAADASILETIEELREQARFAQPDVKPLYLVAIHNLAELRQTKPSQEHLIRALKTISEITGMKMEHQRLLDYAKVAFPSAAPPLELEIPEAELVEDDGPTP